MNRGVCYVTYGPKAEREMVQSAQTLPPALAVAVQPPLDADGRDRGWSDAQRARWAKASLAEWSPFEHSLYLDADTRVYDPQALERGFQMLADGWELVLAASRQQGADWLWHVGTEERGQTRVELAGEALQLQCGVLFFRRCAAVKALFTAWRAEWLRWQGEDQGAFLRALRQCAVRLHLLGQPWNGGTVIGHHWGACRA